MVSGLENATELTVSLWALPLSGATVRTGNLFGLTPM